MKEFVEKLIERLEEDYSQDVGTLKMISVNKVIEIVNQFSEEYKPCNKPCTGCEAYDLVRNHCPKFCKVIKETVRELEENLSGWIPCSDRLPEEHDSIFAKFKGTDKWNNAMFEKISDVVNVTVADEKGKGTTTHAHLVDGKWKCDLLGCSKSYRITHWQPLPEPYLQKED